MGGRIESEPRRDPFVPNSNPVYILTYDQVNRRYILNKQGQQLHPLPEFSDLVIAYLTNLGKHPLQRAETAYRDLKSNEQRALEMITAIHNLSVTRETGLGSRISVLNSKPTAR